MKTLLLSLAASAALASVAFAAPPDRVRGTLVSSSPTSVTVRTMAGETDVIALMPKTRYVTATAASLSDVQAGKFIGTATKDVAGQQVALEVAIFPESMRGTGEGHYPWDSLPGTSATMPASGGGSSMTNGNVAAVMPTRKVTTSMTNGNVQASGQSGGMKTLTVTYNGGQQTIMVPPAAPVVMLAPADAAALHPGASVMVFAAGAPGHMTALAVTVGEGGTKLPM